MWLDRLASSALLKTLEEDPYSFLPTLVKLQPRPGLLDLRFRSNKTDWSEAQFYFGERSLLRLREQNGSLRLRGPEKAVEKVSSEGRVHAALVSRTDYAVIDREVAFRFCNQAEKAAVLEEVKSAIKAVVDAYQASAPGQLPKVGKLGQEADAVAIAADGALEIIEVKPGAATGSLGWTPAQVTVYADLFKRWLANHPGAANVLEKMLEQRVQLGLSPHVSLKRPVQIRPVIAIGHPIRNELVARQRAEGVQHALIAAGLGWANLVAREVDPDGTTSDLGWF
jgi:hypothetical protein